jgi:hypothetical protein
MPWSPSMNNEALVDGSERRTDSPFPPAVFTRRWCMALSREKNSPFPPLKSCHPVAIGHPEAGHRVEDLARDAGPRPVGH